MRLNRRTFLACACCTGAAGLSAASAEPQSDPGAPQLLELGTPSMQRLSATVWVAELAPGAWLHTTTGLLDGKIYYPANGVILDRESSSVLIDTGWNSGQAETLLDWCKQRGRPISSAIATHFHGDRTGGIPALQRRGIPTAAFPLTCDLARAHGKPAPTPIAGFTQGAYDAAPDLELFFPGAGHTRDNIVAWLPHQRILYGGCFLKSATVDSLGYTDDAVVPAWPASLARVREAYNAALVIPGHGTLHGDSLAATRTLLTKAG